MSKVTPLKGDPQRQASDSFRGYVYQIWQTVLAWLDLTDEEILFVEGAEDFDIVSDSSATAVQVKDASANITLRSEAVIDAINNYWNIKEKNPKVPIVYNFLTTSSIGIEKCNPFGKGIAGIQLWTDCQAFSKTIEILRDFLLKKGKLSDPILSFLESSTLDEVFEELIRPLNWNVSSPLIEEITKLVDRKLILIGDRHSISPNDSVINQCRILLTNVVV